MKGFEINEIKSYLESCSDISVAIQNLSEKNIDSAVLNSRSDVPYVNGRNACRRELKQLNNPYKRGTYDFFCWRKGFLDEDKFITKYGIE